MEKGDNSVFYSVLAITLVVGLAIYILGYSGVWLSPNAGKEVWCGSNDEHRDRIYRNYLEAYNSCLDNFKIKEGASSVCSILEDCNKRNGYPACLEECEGPRNLVRNYADFCEGLRIRLQNFIDACYEPGERPSLAKFTPCEDNCNDNTGNS